MNATPTSRYRQRNQNGSTRAFHSRACGATPEHHAGKHGHDAEERAHPIAPKEREEAPAPASTKSQVSLPGNRVAA